MPVRLRPFQQDSQRRVYEAWNSGAQNVMLVSATGSGKTVQISDIIYNEPGASVAIAHRQELVGQMSTAFARNGVRHRIVGARKGSPLIRIISALHTLDVGYSFYDPNAKCGVGGVDTIIKMKDDDGYFKQVRQGVVDEGHHVLADNKWGRAIGMFDHARWLFPSATPLRADGKGLGRWADGLVDVMVEAITMREIIDKGYLTDYTIWAPPSDLDMSGVTISATTGDFNLDQTRKAVHKSHITGDVVKHYLRLAPGKLGVTFAVDIEAATEIAAAFRAAGVKAEVVHAGTPADLRARILRQFKNREVMQLVNVDLFGEGFDLPAVEVVSFARPTASWALFCQQFGRALRLMIDPTYLSNWDSYTDAERRFFISISSKPTAIIIDHVNNVDRHGLPDAVRDMTLGLHRRSSRSEASDAEPITRCANKNVGGVEGRVCAKNYPRYMKKCPHCQHVPIPAARNGPAFVDGDLYELDAETLAMLRGNIAKVDGEVYIPNGVTPEVAGAIRRRHWERKEAQYDLRNCVAWWAGLEHAQGRSEGESYRRFYLKFGTDVASAQALGAREAAELSLRVANELAKCGIDGHIDASQYFIK